MSYLAATELPVVVVNINRPGRFLDLPSQKCTKGGGHGDYRLIVIAPTKGQKLYDFTMEDFDLADKYRTPVMIIADGFLGQIMEPIELKTRQAAVLPDKTWAVGGCRGREKRKVVSYNLTNEAGEENCLRWQHKIDHIRETEQKWENFHTDDVEVFACGFWHLWAYCQKRSA